MEHQQEYQKNDDANFGEENDSAKRPPLFEGLFVLAQYQVVSISQNAEAPSLAEQIYHVKQVVECLETFETAALSDHCRIGLFFPLF